MEHSQADNQHAQLVSIDQANASPIAEEDEGVETTSPLPQFEPTSHCPIPSVPDEGAVGTALVEDSDLDDAADQYILALRDETTGLVQTNVPGEKPLAEVAPAKNVQPAKVIS